MGLDIIFSEKAASCLLSSFEDALGRLGPSKNDNEGSPPVLIISVKG